MNRFGGFEVQSTVLYIQLKGRRICKAKGSRPNQHEEHCLAQPLSRFIRQPPGRYSRTAERTQQRNLFLIVTCIVVFLLLP